MTWLCLMNVGHLLVLSLKCKGSNFHHDHYRNKLLCKLELKDTEFRIQNKKIESTNENFNEYELHIKELLKLRVIQKRTSRHRNSVFIVNKHSEQVRGNSRMVIDYR